MLESGLMPKQAYNIFHKIAKSDDEREALSFDCLTERDLFFNKNTSLIRPTTFETFFGHTGYDIYFTVVCYFFLMTPSVSFYRFPLRTARITNARAVKRFDICLRIMVHLSMAGFALALVRS
jgi:hypothetical protein